VIERWVDEGKPSSKLGQSHGGNRKADILSTGYLACCRELVSRAAGVRTLSPMVGLRLSTSPASASLGAIESEWPPGGGGGLLSALVCASRAGIDVRPTSDAVSVAVGAG
jgi:hypothetical protein